MIAVICWKWGTKYTSEHVNVFRNMVERNYRNEHKVICFTDDNRGLDRRVLAYPLPNQWASIQNPLGPDYPSCYRRLAAFTPAFENLVGERFVSVDLDCVIVGDVTPLWDREDDIVFWESPHSAPDYNGSMWLVKTGSRPALYDDFDPNVSPILTKRAGHLGSDQGWFSYRCPGEAVWTGDDGVWSWKPQLRNRMYRLPLGSRIVFFPGDEQPWQQAVHDVAPWVRKYYR